MTKNLKNIPQIETYLDLSRIYHLFNVQIIWKYLFQRKMIFMWLVSMWTLFNTYNYRIELENTYYFWYIVLEDAVVREIFYVDTQLVLRTLDKGYATCKIFPMSNKCLSSLSVLSPIQ